MKIAVLGCGVVGGGVVELCKGREDLSVKKILDLRQIPGIEIPITSNYDEILNDPEIEIVVETMGGIHPASDFALAALKAGKHFVSANKAMFAATYDALTTAAREKNLGLRCTAAAGGGIPWLYELGRIAEVDRIVCLSGIMNGTTNYILDRMTKENAEFAAVLAEAQKLGYAEANPTADIDGLDIRRKLVLSANVAFGVSVKEEDIPMHGIRGISAEDIASFRGEGLVCRMIGSAVNENGKITASVVPVLFPETAPEAAVSECFNRFTFTAERIGTRAFFGQGAGSLPTAANIVRDCMDIHNGFRGFYTGSFAPAEISKGAVAYRWYVRTAEPESFPIERKMGSGYVTGPMTFAELEPLAEKAAFLAQFQNK